MRRSNLVSRIAVRAYAHGDLAAVERIVPSAIGRTIVPTLAKRLALATTRAFVAERDGAVAGFVTLTLYGTIAYVGSMAVDPAQQRGGIGSALMWAIIDYCREHGPAALALDATDAGAPLYARFGFVTTDRTIVLVRESPFAMTLGRSRDRPDVARAISFDRSLLHCDRAEVLTMLANEHGATAIAERDGYGIAWNGAIGPLVARTPHAARAIFTRLVRENEPITRILVPESTPLALEIAAEHGFKIASVAGHMARGESPFTRESIFARAGHSYG